MGHARIERATSGLRGLDSAAELFTVNRDIRTFAEASATRFATWIAGDLADDGQDRVEAALKAALESWSRDRDPAALRKALILILLLAETDQGKEG